LNSRILPVLAPIADLCHLPHRDQIGPQSRPSGFGGMTRGGALMVDFKKLRESKSKPKPIHPREIFNSLPKPPGINDLYASQAEVLDAWFARRAERDLVVKLHTGGGKTLVALLMAQSVMNEIGEPVVYLAPTNQLVGQAIAK